MVFAIYEVGGRKSMEDSIEIEQSSSLINVRLI
jgi:hypothetical protein